MNTPATKDYIIFFIYFIIVAAYRYWIYWKEKKTVTDTKDFFPGRGLINMAGLSVLRQKMRLKKFQNLKF